MLISALKESPVLGFLSMMWPCYSEGGEICCYFGRILASHILLKCEVTRSLTLVQSL